MYYVVDLLSTRQMMVETDEARMQWCSSSLASWREEVDVVMATAQWKIRDNDVNDTR